jgi:hypothetical protein
MDQPDHYRSVNAKCPDCIYGSPQLPQSNRNQALADFQLYRLKATSFVLSWIKRMSLKKHIFAVISPERLTYGKAQLRQVLRGNLEKVLKYSSDQTTIWTHGRNDLMMPFLRYQRTLITCSQTMNFWPKQNYYKKLTGTWDSEYIDGISCAIHMLKELEDILRTNYERRFPNHCFGLSTLRKFLLDISAIGRITLPNCRLEEKMSQHCKQCRTKNTN